MAVCTCSSKPRQGWQRVSQVSTEQVATDASVCGTKQHGVSILHLLRWPLVTHVGGYCFAGDADARLEKEGLAGSVVVGCDNSPSNVTLSGMTSPHAQPRSCYNEDRPVQQKNCDQRMWRCLSVGVSGSVTLEQQPRILHCPTGFL